MTSLIVTAVVAVTLSAASFATAATPTPPGATTALTSGSGEDTRHLSARAGHGAFEVIGDEIAAEGEQDSGPARDDSIHWQVREVDLSYCGGNEHLAVSADMCVAEIDGQDGRTVCQDGSVPRPPRMHRPVDAVTGEVLGLWEVFDLGGCPEDPPVTVVLTATQFRSLPLAPSPIHLQPVDGHGVVHMDTILMTDPAPQTLHTTVLGVPVTVTAIPVSFTWDLGDGSDPITTTDPGAPWPHPTVTGTYHHHGDYTLTLTTTWSGTYQVNHTGPTLPVTGTATTSSTTDTHIHQITTHLVTNP